MATISINLFISFLALKPAGKGPAATKKITTKKARGLQGLQVHCCNLHNKPPFRLINAVRRARDFNGILISSMLSFIIVFMIVFMVTNIL